MSAMSRRIDFEDEALVVRFEGLAAFTTLTREVRIPYTAVGSVSIGLTDPPGLLAVKIGLSMPPFGIDWSSATARFNSRPLTPPFLLISFTASAAPARNWMPHGAKFPESDVSTPTLIGAAAPAALDPPYAVEPPTAAVSTVIPATAATNQNRFTDSSFVIGRRSSAAGHAPTGQAAIPDARGPTPPLAPDRRSVTG